MNMKLNRLIAIALFATAFASCEKFLDQPPVDQFTNDNYWSSETNVEKFTNRFYDLFIGYGTEGNSVFYFPTLNDNQASGSFRDWNYKQVPASVGTWNDCYTNIRRANLLIEKIPTISAMSDAAKNNWLGVARLIRAWQHYELVRSFGDVIWVDKVLDVTSDDKEAYLYGPRQDRDEVMDKVLEDLNFAVANITMNASSHVLINAAVAQAIKSEICLYEGTFCKYRVAADGQKAPDVTRANKFLTEAKAAANAIMGNSMYQLNKSYQANYNSIDLKDNKEMILYKHYEMGVLSHSMIAYTSSSTKQNGLSKAAFDSYLFTDGKPLATTSMDKTDHPTLDPATGRLKLDAILAVRDSRLAASIDNVLMYDGNDFARFGVGMATTSSTGYGVSKFDNGTIATNYRQNTQSNYTDAPVIWLAVIYLNYAEACAELGACTQADLDISINKLRDRAGMPHLTTIPEADPANNMGVSDLIWEIRRERRVELMFDNNDRYWSLIRWHQLDKLDTQQYPDQLRGAYVKDDPKVTAKTDAEGYIVNTHDLVRIYDKKHYLVPIPSDQISLYEAAGKTLTQNPGW